MKKIVVILFMVVFSLILVSCTDAVLETPNTTLTGDTLSWDAVDGALLYYVYVDDTSTTEVEMTYYEATGTSFDLSTLSLADGVYSVYVAAVAGTSFSSYSSVIIYEVGEESLTLSSPTNVTLTGDVLSWSAVTNATGYTIFIDTVEVNVTGTSYDLSQQSLDAGTYSVHVVATAGTVESPNSASVSYTVSAQMSALDTILAGILPIVDEDYTIGLVEADFDESWEYEDYMSTVDGVTVFAQAAIDAGLMSSEAINFFEDIFMLITTPEAFHDLSSFLDVTDIFVPNNITAEVAAQLAMVAINQMVPMALDGLDMQIESLQSMVDDYALEVDNYLASANVMSFMSEIAANTPEAAMPTVDKLMAGDQESAMLLLVIADKLVDLYEENDYLNDNYYRDDLMDEDVDHVILIAEEIASENPAFLTSIYDIRSTLYNLNNAFWDLHDYTRNLDQMTMLLERANDIIDLVDEDTEMFEEAIAIIFDFVLTLRESFPENVVTLIDSVINDEVSLTLAEMILIKNELVALVSEALPAEEDFQLFYEVLLMVGEVGLDNTIIDLQDHADYLGSISYHSISLELVFIGSVEAADVETAMDLIEDLQMTYEESSPLDDPAPLIAALSFVRTYIDDFKTENSDEVAVLEALLNAEAFEPLFQEILTQLAVVATDQNPEELDMILYILDALTDEYDQLFALFDAVQNVGLALFDAFIDSDGSILSLIGDTQNLENPDMATIVSTLESLIDEAALYHGVIHSALTSENIENVLSLLVVPAMAASGMYTDPSFETAVRALIPDIAQVIMNVLMLEQDVFAGLNAMDIDTYIDQTLGFAEPVDLGSAIAIIHLFDALLTTENETLIDDTIDLVFTNILGNTTLQSALPIDPLELPNIRTDVESMVDDFITNIHMYAAIDFTTLSPEDEAAIMHFANQFNLFINTSGNDEDMMDNAIVLTEDVIASSFYKTDYLWYAFTPTVSGTYTFAAIFNDVLAAHVEVRTEYEWFDIMDAENTSIEVTSYLQENVTYYVILSLERDVYVDVDVEISQTVLSE